MSVSNSVIPTVVSMYKQGNYFEQYPMFGDFSSIRYVESVMGFSQYGIRRVEQDGQALVVMFDQQAQTKKQKHGVVFDVGTIRGDMIVMRDRGEYFAPLSEDDWDQFDVWLW